MGPFYSRGKKRDEVFPIFLELKNWAYFSQFCWTRFTGNVFEKKTSENFWMDSDNISW